MATVLTLPFTAWHDVVSVWTELAEASPYTSFFLSTEWIETWLEVFGPILRPEIVLFKTGGSVEGACLLVRRTDRRGPVPVHRVYLNAAGEDEADETCLEFNNLLCRERAEQDVARALGEHLRGRQWDELVLQSMLAGEASSAVKACLEDIRAEAIAIPGYYVNLRRLRESNITYEAFLGNSTRHNFKKSLNYYRQAGEVRLVEAETISEAVKTLDILAELHQQRWESRGRPGVFASPRFVAFHHALVQRAFVTRNIQLLRIDVAGETLGALYNFVHRKKVYSYQSGFAYNSNSRLSPGTVTLVSAIQHCLEQPGLDEFHFMAGDSPYKKALASDHCELVSYTLLRPSVKASTLQLLRQVKRMYRGRRSA